MSVAWLSRVGYLYIALPNIGEASIDRHTHSDLRDYISDTTRSNRRMHAWRLTRFISRFHGRRSHCLFYTGSCGKMVVSAAELHAMSVAWLSRVGYLYIALPNIGEASIDRHTHSDLRDYISDTTRSNRRMHAWRLTRFISRFHVSFKF